MKIKNLLLVALLVVSAKGSFAQDREWGGFLGISVYNGDLAQSPIPFRGMRPAIGGLYRYNFNTRWAIKTGLNIGYIASYDRYSGKGTTREYRNLSFHSPLVELSVVAELNLRKYVAGSRKYDWAPYLFGGVAGFYFNPQTYLNGKKYALRTMNTEQQKIDDGPYQPLGIAIPLGVGVKYSLDKRKLWNLGFEVGFRLTFTDYLDDVSGDLPTDIDNNTNITPEERALAYRGSTQWPKKWARGNPDNNDAYAFFGVTLTKTIRKYKCF